MYKKPYNADAPLRKAIRFCYLADEQEVINNLLKSFKYKQSQNVEIKNIAKLLVQAMRHKSQQAGLIDSFLQEFTLSSQEGITLMCLAEALLRIPDSKTSNFLISDKLKQGDWQAHLGKSSSFLVNAATWGMMLTGNWVAMDDYDANKPFSTLKHLITKSGESAIRLAVRRAVKIISKQFVLAQTIAEAVKKSHNQQKKGFNYSFDMLGESAKTTNDAKKYYNSYVHAIKYLAKSTTSNSVVDNAGISVKLSALHPRYELAQTERVEVELYERLLILAKLAKSAQLGFNIDAEEADKMELSLTLFEKLAFEPDLAGWQGIGFVIQAYQKRAYTTVKWLVDLAKRSGRRFMIRIVKGAYWDSEIKIAQVQGLVDFPVFTCKENTDLSYLACAQKLIDANVFYLQFATHNARTVADIMFYAKENNYHNFEFQCLHGMGEPLYLKVIEYYGHKCRIYAPVGKYKYLLSYLTRRLLENGANTSFINLLANKNTAIDDLIQDVVAKVSSKKQHRHPHIALAQDLYGSSRENSIGVNLHDCDFLDKYYSYVADNKNKKWFAKAIIATDEISNIKSQKVFNPAHTAQLVGERQPSSVAQINVALNSAYEFNNTWDIESVNKRCDILNKAADLYELHKFELIYLCQQEAGKTLIDAVSEVREAIDFLRYYAQQACLNFGKAITMLGPTGECNKYELHGRGIFACISPWNFPLAIFTGQVSAALVTGNTVLAKPAIQTSLIAYRAVQLLHQAGIPRPALQYLIGDANVGMHLTSDVRIQGVAFTGSISSSHAILKTLLKRPDASIPHLIAETGGINAMIVDSSALFEQVTDDVISSAFQSAGQRCSALRVLYLQEDIAYECLTMIKGALAELITGDPMLLNTDIGPIIDANSLKALQAHIAKYQKKLLLTRASKPTNNDGYYFEPAIIEINNIKELKKEVFGPILHVIRFKANDLKNVIDMINASGYRLTLGIHSRIDSTISFITKRVKVGNIYINRDMIGAVVGVQPFGGSGLSGTGPKAGGPNYLAKFALEQTISTNTAAAGGNPSLFNLI